MLLTITTIPLTIPALYENQPVLVIEVNQEEAVNIIGTSQDVHTNEQRAFIPKG